MGSTASCFNDSQKDRTRGTEQDMHFRRPTRKNPSIEGIQNIIMPGIKSKPPNTGNCSVSKYRDPERQLKSHEPAKNSAGHPKLYSHK